MKIKIDERAERFGHLAGKTVEVTDFRIDDPECGGIGFLVPVELCEVVDEKEA